MTRSVPLGKFQLSSSILIVSAEKYRPPDHFRNSSLVLLRQIVKESRWQTDERYFTSGLWPDVTRLGQGTRIRDLHFDDRHDHRGVRRLAAAFDTEAHPRTIQARLASPKAKVAEHFSAPSFLQRLRRRFTSRDYKTKFPKLATRLNLAFPSNNIRIRGFSFPLP
ncbi:MAG: hypothetical protein WA211_13380 [Candidatus Acidiferrales bacterium]